ncbi:MAG: Putative formate dehydrogenase [Acidimicrobiaceae bacterium]|jgi:predicted molibdopterin-dependent oxidoreductase YjgC|nr:MAG: Putative formate dehydrogenase [Acidimicrobiaceae bacterium]|tara:strand:+ start:1418 stop:1657 length:240 start_codon:yes stop_codon:yes gene_type:complete
MTERLTVPMLKENGKLREATWEEALNKVAEGFKSVIDLHGSEAFGMFSCSKTTNEVNYAAQKFARKVLGSNNIDSCNRT